MQTSEIALNSQADAALATNVNDPLVDERVHSEQYLAELLGTHIQQVHCGRRKDAEAGTIGERTPTPTWISARRVGYRARHIREWLDRRTADGRPADISHAA